MAQSAARRALPRGWDLSHANGTYVALFGTTGVSTPSSGDAHQVVSDAKIIDRQIRAGAYPEAHAYAAEIDGDAPPVETAPEASGDGGGLTVIPLDPGDEAPPESNSEPERGLTVIPSEAIEPEVVTVETTTDRGQLARQMHRHVEMSTQVTAVALHTIQEHQLFRELGCTSFREYCEIEAGIPYSTGKLYTGLGRKTLALYPGLSLASGAAAPPEAGRSDEEEAASSLFGLGPSKLRLLYQHVEDPDALRAFASGETITLDSGAEISLEEFEAMTRAEATRELRKERQKLQSKVDKLRAEVKSGRDTVRNAESDIKAAKRDTEKAEKRADRLDAVYGGEATRFEAKQTTLGVCRELLNDLNRALSNCGVQPDDDEELIHDFADVARKLDAVRDRHHERFAEVFAAIADRI